MTNRHKKHLLGIAGLTSLLAVMAISSNASSVDSFEKPYSAQTFAGSTMRPHISAMSDQHVRYPNTSSYRIAARLQKRLRLSGAKIAPPVASLEQFVRDRQALLRHKSTVTFIADPNVKGQTWDISAQRYPLWLSTEFSAATASIRIDTNAIARSMKEDAALHIRTPEHAIAKNVMWSEHGEKASRVIVEGIAKSGYSLDEKNATAGIAAAFKNGKEEITIHLDFVPGKILNETGLNLGALQLLSTGRSDFRGSDNSRIANVKKAIDQHVNNTIVGTDEEYSFNATLDGPVSQGNGWHMAKVIFNGGDLEYAPGGGICQASTTVYRAVLLAGLPVLERKAHSLYVTYYKKFGVGIDATIYPGSQDLTFRNDTGNPLIIQSYYEGTEAFVNIYGTPDGRVAELQGPYFAATAPSEVIESAKGIASNEIVWIHTVRMADGTIRTGEVSSRYKQMPRSLITEYATPETILHAAAPGVLTD